MSNWKTTAAGMLAGVLNLLANGMTLKQVGLSLGLGILGVMSKDLNVTGGTKQQ